MLYFVYLILVTLYSPVIILRIKLRLYTKEVKVFRSFFSDVKLYVVYSLVVIDIHVLKIFHILLNDERGNSVLVSSVIPKIYVLEFVVLEKVVMETVAILSVVIRPTINPAQALQRNDVIPLVSVIIAVKVPQIYALVHVRYINVLCR